MDGPINGVNDVAQTVLGTEVVVLLAAVVLLMSIGIVAILWYFGRSFSKQSDASIEQIKLFNRTLSDAGALNSQLLTANGKNVETLDRIGDQIVRIGDMMKDQQAFFNQTLVLIQKQDVTLTNAINTSQAEHAQIVGRVDEMNGGVIEEIRHLRVQMDTVENSLAELRRSDAITDQLIHELTEQLIALNSKVGLLLERLSKQDEAEPEQSPDGS